MPVGVCAFVCVLPLQTYLFLRLMPCVLVTFCCACVVLSLLRLVRVFCFCLWQCLLCLSHVLLLATLGLGLPVKLRGHSVFFEKCRFGFLFFPGVSLGWLSCQFAPAVKND